jgi:hypothetical protein
MKKIEMLGRIFGKLTVIAKSEKRTTGIIFH